MSAADRGEKIVVAGAGYAGLHVAQRSGAWLRRRPRVEMVLVDRYDYHQLTIELPRVATGTRAEEAVRIDLQSLLGRRVGFVQATVTGIDLARDELLTESGPIAYSRLVLALGSAPNDFDIPGLRERVLFPYSADDAERVWSAVNESVRRAGKVSDGREQQRLQTVVIGGGGATGVELAGGFAEELPRLARQYGAPPEGRVVLIEAGPTILAGSSAGLIRRAGAILRNLGVDVRTNTAIAGAAPEGFKLKNGEVIDGGVYIWAGGVKAPALLRGSGLPVGYNGRVKVDQYLRVLDHPEIFAVGDIASVIDPETGRALPPLAQVAVEEGETVAHNLRNAIAGRPLEPFQFRDKGFVVSVGGRRGVAEVRGVAMGGRLANALKDAIEWEYRQSVQHLRGWGAV